MNISGAGFHAVVTVGVLTSVFIEEVGLQFVLEDWVSDSDDNPARTEKRLEETSLRFEGLQVQTFLWLEVIRNADRGLISALCRGLVCVFGCVLV